MVQYPHLDPAAFFLEGGSVGVLLIHGFTGAPTEMRLIGNYLHQHGYTVSGPLLPGHGTTIEDLNRSRWTDWASHVKHALTDLQTRCETVFVSGLSLGSILTLYLAAHHPELGGIITYSPALWVVNRLIYLTPVLKYLVRTRPKSGEADLTDPKAATRMWSYDHHPTFGAHEVLKLMRQVRPLLPRITCPLLIIHSTLDSQIDPTSAQRTYDRIGSTDKELVTLHNSGHALTVDSEWESVAQKTYKFIQAHQ